MVAEYALLLYDEFNGVMISDSSVVVSEGGRILSPLRKPDGFYVILKNEFVAAESTYKKLEIARPHYFKKTVEFDVASLDPSFPTVSVRLHRRYPGTFADCGWVHGVFRPKTTVFVSDELKNVKVGAADDGKYMIMGCTAGRLIGKRFSFNADGRDSFLITGSTAAGVYRATCKSTEKTGKSQALYAVYTSFCGADGKYSIPVESGREPFINNKDVAEGVI